MKKIVLLAAMVAYVIPSMAQVVEEVPARTIKGLKSRVTHFSMNPKQDRLIVGFGQYAAMYDMNKGKKMTVFEHDMNGCSEVYYTEYHPEKDIVLTYDAKAKKRFWDANTGKLASSDRGNRDFGPDNRDALKMGLDNSNPSNKYYYIQTEVAIPGGTIVAKATNKGTIIFVDTAKDDTVLQEIKFEEVKDKFHLPPCWVTPDGEYFVTGTDSGEIRFYKIK